MDAGLSLPKILLGTSMAESRTDAERKIKAGAVEIDGVKFTKLPASRNKAGDSRDRSARKWKRIVSMIATPTAPFCLETGRRRELLLGERTLLMGVLNVTPDSFSDGGKYSDPDRAFARAVELEEQGADIIDIGAESTKPGSERVSEAEELRRLVPVLKRLHGKLDTPVSVDTYKSAVAEKALEYGAAIDQRSFGLTFDAQLARIVANHDAGLIITHMRGTPETWAKLAPLKDPARDHSDRIWKRRRIGPCVRAWIVARIASRSRARLRQAERAELGDPGAAR